MKFVILPVVLFSTLLAGCSMTEAVKYNSQPHLINEVVITTPLAPSAKSEEHIARYTEIISRVKLNNDQLAKMYYDRGVIYESLGLKLLAEIDFVRALKVKPDFADAYNNLGIQYTLAQEYNKAFDAFDSALEIDPEHSYVQLNRGIALYYYGRHELARDDLESFYIKNPKDGYRAIWLYLAEHSINEQDAQLRLIYHASQLDKTRWPYQLVQMLLNNIDDKTFIRSMMKNTTSSRQLAERLCEGYFYLAKRKVFEGDIEAAKNYFRLALSNNVYEFVEHKFARLELNNLNQRRYLSPLSVVPRVN